MTTGYSKSEKIDPWVSKSEGKGTKSEPRDTKSEPKGTQREPKGAKSEPAGAESEPTGAKRAPKVSQIRHKINIKDKVSKKVRKRSPRKDEMGARPSIPRTILGAFFMKKR